MTNWPTAPIILIKHGLKIREEIKGELAIRNMNGNYLTQKCVLYSEGERNEIDAWEEVTPVPTAALATFKKAWESIGSTERPWIVDATPAARAIIDYLPADKPSPLDQAVTKVKDVGGPMVDAETLPAERLALLMDALASVQSATSKAAPLAMVARICVDWVQADKEEVVAVEQMRSRARSMPEVIGSDPAKFLVLAGIVGETASMLGDGHPSVSGELVNAGTYALAWAAQIIEEDSDD